MVRWGEPTPAVGPTGARTWIIQKPDVENVVNYLEQIKGNFFIFPDWTILYGLLGKCSPQPVLWFHKGLTYPSRYDADLDRWIVKDLTEHDIQAVVIEESWGGSQKRLRDFPELNRYIESHFRPKRAHGVFTIWEKD